MRLNIWSIFDISGVPPRILLRSRNVLVSGPDTRNNVPRIAAKIGIASLTFSVSPLTTAGVRPIRKRIVTPAGSMT